MTDYLRPVDTLIARYAKGRSVRELERANGLPEGSLSNSLKPSNRGKIPKLHVMQRFAEVLETSLDEVSIAFGKEAGVALVALANDEIELVETYRLLPQSTKNLMRGCVALAAVQHQEAQAEGTTI